MAKQKGPLKIQGTIDDLTFLRTQEGFRVRLKGGVSKDRILNDPVFERTRENMTEFAHCANTGKLLRRAASELVKYARDKHMSSRLTGVLAKIKNYDTTSPRGERKVSIGIAQPEAIELLKGFEFNKKSSLSLILQTSKSLDPLTGEVTIPNFIPKNHLLAPTFASHVSLSAAFMKFDFETGEYELSKSNVENLPIDMTETNVTLTPASVPAGTGVALYFLLIEFSQIISNQQYPLKGGSFNALSILEAV